MRLLVSVIDAGEVPAAIAGGADIIDVKNPSRGPLGAPDAEALRRVRAAAPLPRTVSAALGDAARFTDALGVAAREAATSGVDVVKVGLVGEVRGAGVLLRALVEAVAETGSRARVVAVAYADTRPESFLFALPDAAATADAYAVMLDTASKDGRSLLTHLQERTLERWIGAVHTAGLLAGCAGSLGTAEIGRLRCVRPDVVGVRGAACAGGRLGRIDAERVRLLRQALGAAEPASTITTSHSIPAGSAFGK